VPFVVVGCVLAVAGFVVLGAGVGGAVAVGVAAAGAGAVTGLTAVGGEVGAGALGAGIGCTGGTSPCGELGESTALVAACSIRILPFALTSSPTRAPESGANRELVAACSMSGRGPKPATASMSSGELSITRRDDVAK
jgi:hypothetical protein